MNTYRPVSTMLVGRNIVNYKLACTSIGRAALLVIGLALGPTASAEWQYYLGAHDLSVPDVDSQTFGINVTFYNDHVTDGGIALDTAVDFFLDHDKDHLDPDHIPIWWMVDFEAKKSFFEPTPNVTLDWLLDIDTKANTVSSVERQIKALPGIAAEYANASFDASLKASAGYYFLEIDDDVAKTFGYTRDDFRHSTSAVALSADIGMAIASSGRLSGSLAEWSDGSAWLEKQFLLSMSFDTNLWRPGSKVLFEAEYTQYNLDHYVPSEPTTSPYSPILPWDDDVLFRLSFVSAF